VRKEANEYLDELLAAMKQDRPSITEEQMNGAMFKMKDVVGTLIDGICTLPELCEKIYADWAVSANASVSGAASDDNNQANINPNSNQMKEFKNIALALGYNEPMASQVDDMLSLQPQEAEALEGKLESMTESVATLTAENTTLKEREVAINASLATLTIERDAARKEVEELRAAIAESDETKVNAVREEMQATIDSMAAEKTALEEAKAGVEAQLAAVNDEMATIKANADEAATKAATDMAEKEQIISDLQAQLAEAQSGIESKVDAGESAATNGQAAGVSMMTSAPAWDPNKTPSENHAAMQSYLDEQRKKVK
jgi:chromosome segregation ATPase